MEFQMFRPVATFVSLGMVAIVLELIRRRKLKDELWVPWLVIAIAPLVASLWISPWATVAGWLGIIYEPALLLGLATGLCVVMILYLTVVISTLMQRNLRLAQELALLGARIERGESAQLQRAPVRPTAE
jgi:peptidoglycan/LPS O-acetylase OafA/YrhL